MIIDHAGFAFCAGIPAINLGFKVDKKVEGAWFYPPYHTGYDTFYLVDKIIDPGNNSSKFLRHLNVLFVAPKACGSRDMVYFILNEKYISIYRGSIKMIGKRPCNTIMITN